MGHRETVGNDTPACRGISVIVTLPRASARSPASDSRAAVPTSAAARPGTSGSGRGALPGTRQGRFAAGVREPAPGSRGRSADRPLVDQAAVITRCGAMI